MSTALAIAATSRVITAVIDEAVAAAGLPFGAPSTSTSPPDHIATGVDTEPTKLNLFLYHVTYNQGWREVGLPTRNGDGAAINRTPLAIDLHYLLSAYSPGDYEAQMLLGVGMQALHENPVLTRDRISTVFVSENPSVLGTARLAEQIELVKITPQQLSTEELSKLWTAFPNEFRVSAAYAVSVLLIESKAPVKAALPVLSRTLTAFPLSEPVVEAANPPFVPFGAAALRIAGQNLAGRDTFVQFDGEPDALKTAVPVSGGREVSVELPTGLPIGINTFHVIRRMQFGSTTKTIVRSNVGSFVLQPVITSTTTLPSGSIGVTINPPRNPGQTASILLNEVVPMPPAQLGHASRSFVFDAAPLGGTAPSDTVEAATPELPQGTYLVRVRIEGADSPLDVNSATNQFAAPAVTIQ
jgi:Pvc16 N-terminal domain